MERQWACRRRALRSIAFRPTHAYGGWREEFARGFLRLDIEPQDRAHFRADTTIRALPGLKIASCSISASHWRRTRMLLDPGAEYFGLMFGTAGPSLLSQRGRTLDSILATRRRVPTQTGGPGASRREWAARGSCRSPEAAVGAGPRPRGDDTSAHRSNSDAVRLLVGYLDALADATTLANPDSAGPSSPTSTT